MSDYKVFSWQESIWKVATSGKKVTLYTGRGRASPKHVEQMRKIDAMFARADTRLREKSNPTG